MATNRNAGWLILATLTLCLLLFCLPPPPKQAQNTAPLPSPIVIPVPNSSTIVEPIPKIVERTNMTTITCDYTTEVLTNKLQPGIQLDNNSDYFRSNATIRQLFKDINIKLVRWFPQRITGGDPCTSWNPPTYNWQYQDDIITKIQAMGATPMPVLGFCGSSGWTSPANVPKNANDFATYCKAWATRYNLTRYEIMNEAHNGFSHGGFSTAAEFLQIYNAAVDGMQSVRGGISFGNDNSMGVSWSQGGVSTWRDWFAANCPVGNIQFLSWHGYTSGGTRQLSDANVILQSYTNEGGTYASSSGTTYIAPAVTEYAAHGHGSLNCIESEANMNWDYPTDSRIQQMVNAVCLATRHRMYILNGNVTYDIYFDEVCPTPGSGVRAYGMIHRTNLTQYYPYLYYKLMFSNDYGNLSYGDSVKTSSSSSATVQTLAWVHGNKKLLLINLTPTLESLEFEGVSGTWNKHWIDNATMAVQSGTVTLSGSTSINLNGYTVMLLEEATNQMSATGNANIAMTSYAMADGNARIAQTQYIEGTGNATLEAAVPACAWGTPTAQQYEIFHLWGDVNYDGVIDATDLALVQARWGESGTPGWVDEDLNRDGFIDAEDLNRVGANFGKSICDLNVQTTSGTGNAEISEASVVSADGCADIAEMRMAEADGNATITQSVEPPLVSEAPQFLTIVSQLENLPQPRKIVGGGDLKIIGGGTPEIRGGVLTDHFEKILKQVKDAR